MKRSLLLCLLFTVLLRLPFLNQAIQGDDVYYLYGAEHALIDPGHPHDTSYVFRGDLVSMRGHPHPPLNSWVLAGLLAIWGDVYEIRFHAAWMLFSLLAVGAVWWLARRFTGAPTLPTLLFSVTAAFVVNANSFEPDVPLVALLMAGTALLVHAADSGSLGAAGGSAVALALAAMTGYQAVLFTPILAAYLWFRRSRRWREWLIICAPVLVVMAWQGYERFTSGSVPLAVLHHYTDQYAFQNPTAKLLNAAALTVHLGWLIFPVLAAVAFRPRWRSVLMAIAVVSAGLAFHDWNPLCWASFGAGLIVLTGCVTRLRSRDADERFLAVWVVLYFAGAVAGAFAGSERYLLPVVAAVAILAARLLPSRRWLVVGIVGQGAISLALAFVNYQHWDGYREFVAAHREDIYAHRTWVAAEWSLRFYAESEGALSMTHTTQVQAGDLVLTSALSDVVTGNRTDLIPVAEAAIVPDLPLRLIGLGSRSCFSAAAGLREFDVVTRPVDIIREQKPVSQEPTLAWLPMNSPAAAYQIVVGAYGVENGQWRWIGPKATFRLRTPPGGSRLTASIFVPPQAVPCRVTLSVDNVVVANTTYTSAGKYDLTGTAPGALPEAVTATLTTDHTFRAPGDARDLGLVLTAIGFAGY